jgi:RNA polymerase sigma-70 factor (ECF subfamily)
MLPIQSQFELGTRSDTTLVRFAKEGDAAAFEELVRRHTLMIQRVAAHITNSREDAEDIAQEAFLKAFQNLQTFEERARFSTWLTRISINQALMKVRRPRRSPMISIDDERGEFRSLEHNFTDGRSDPEQIVQRTQLTGILQRELDALPYAHRVVLLMRDIEGLSTLDTAEALALSVSSVKSRLLRARLRLRKNLGPHFGRSRVATVVPQITEAIRNESRAA